MAYKFTIDGRLAGLNDYLAAERVSFRGGKGSFTTKGNILKQDTQKKIIACIRRDLGGLMIKKPIRIHYRFYEPNKKRDLDNVMSFAMKVTQDSLVKANVIEDDGWKWVYQISAEFFVDTSNPRIEVYLVEKEG